MVFTGVLGYGIDKLAAWLIIEVISSVKIGKAGVTEGD